jgi:plasmid stabilization system protein ParE
MSVELVWSERAMLRMTEIGDFIADRSPTAAARVIASLFDRVVVLADHPQLGIVFPGSPTAGVRILYIDKYRVFYLHDDAAARVVILTVRHAPQPPLPLEQLRDEEEP